MSKNSLKKMIIFSSERTKFVIENIISDEAICENRSASALIEKHLFNDLFPKEKNARLLVEKNLYGENGSIEKTLEGCFVFLSAGQNFDSAHDNALPIVNFAKNQSLFSNTVLNGKERELHHFCSQLDSICQRLESLSDENTENKSEYIRELRSAKFFFKESTEEPQYIKFFNYYQILLNNWEDLKGWTITYRFLADLVRLQKDWINTPETRFELLNLLKEVSDNWE